MKEIELLATEEIGSIYDEELGHYKILKEGLDDIIVVKNCKYKVIKQVDVSILGDTSKKYVIETLTNSEKHIVKPLDTVYSIAKQYNKTMEEIIKKNNLKTDKLFIGQIIEI